MQEFVSVLAPWYGKTVYDKSNTLTWFKDFLVELQI